MGTLFCFKGLSPQPTDTAAAHPVHTDSYLPALAGLNLSKGRSLTEASCLKSSPSRVAIKSRRCFPKYDPLTPKQGKSKIPPGPTKPFFATKMTAKLDELNLQ